MDHNGPLFDPLTLPCGTVLKNRIVKSAMSDSLGDGTGHPTPAQNRLYECWALGGLAASIVGEVQGTSKFAEKPGNLVLDENSNLDLFKTLAQAGRQNNAHLWLQLGHAGALAFAPTSSPKGPSPLDLPGLTCSGLSLEEIQDLPGAFARTALLAKSTGFGGVQIHAAHGFLLSQFLSPLFNRRDDDYGGPIENRMRLLLQSVNAVRDAVGAKFPIAVKLNSSDLLEGGLDDDDALRVIGALDKTSADLIDVSGGTYFPGAKAASDGAGSGPYFVDFARRAKTVTRIPLMLTGGIKTRDQAEELIASGLVDVVGLARAFVLQPDLANHWARQETLAPKFPRFHAAPEGGITAWYTMKLTQIAEGTEDPEIDDLDVALKEYESRDATRTQIWLDHFER